MESDNYIENQNAFYEASLEFGWIKLPKIINCLPTLSASAKLIYAELINIWFQGKRQSPDEVVICPKQKTLGRYCGLRQSTVSEALKQLIEHGLIAKQQIDGTFPTRLKYILLEIPKYIRDFANDDPRSANDNSYRNAYITYRNAYITYRNAYVLPPSETPINKDVKDGNHSKERKGDTSLLPHEINNFIVESTNNSGRRQVEDCGRDFVATGYHADAKDNEQEPNKEARLIVEQLQDLQAKYKDPRMKVSNYMTQFQIADEYLKIIGYDELSDLINKEYQNAHNQGKYIASLRYPSLREKVYREKQYTTLEDFDQADAIRELRTRRQRQKGGFYEK